MPVPAGRKARNECHGDEALLQLIEAATGALPEKVGGLTANFLPGQAQGSEDVHAGAFA